MSRFAFAATNGSENPTKVCFPFLQAKNAEWDTPDGFVKRMTQVDNVISI